MISDVHHVLARSVAGDDRTRVLKHADAFGVFDHHGDIVPGGLGEQGLYSGGTRFLSMWLLDLQGVRPFFLGATIRDEADRLATSFTNPDVVRDGIVRMPLGTIHLTVQKFLWRDVLHQRITVTSYADATLNIEIAVRFQADFADIFEVRGVRRTLRGAYAPADHRERPRRPRLSRARRRRAKNVARVFAGSMHPRRSQRPIPSPRRAEARAVDRDLRRMFL